jgi:diaminobutyrate-2-oxoglutarate transaminase
MTLEYTGPLSNETAGSTTGEVFEALESNVRSYCRSFPAVFSSAKGSYIYDAEGEAYLDFLAGAGALNFGHNHDRIKGALVDYIVQDGMTHGLDLHTTAKAAFLEAFAHQVMAPRGLDYRIQFTGPTGANAVEAALKLARKVTGRSGVFAFMGGYHGHSLGALAATANRTHRAAAGTELGGVTFLPYPRGPMAQVDTLAYLRTVLLDSHSGIEIPAAIILETVQAEGGIYVAPVEWLVALRQICDDHDILLIVDEIQTGVGRTGEFFSFERAGIVPDLVTVSKSLSGYGLPLSMVMIRPELDRWSPGEHTGTFRGHQLAFVTAAAALDVYFGEDIEARTQANGAYVAERLGFEIARLDPSLEYRGLGLLAGLDTAAIDPSGEFAAQVAKDCFAQHLIVERVGRADTVLKLLPPLTISEDELATGLDVIVDSIAAAF